ncbi:MAG: crossover junction endodeoxyribonuclease RuvC [Planctomycetota bacterium]
MTAVRILGIDPGTIVVGWACIEVMVEVRGVGVAQPSAVPLAARASNLVRHAPAGDGTMRLVEAGAIRLGRGAIEQRLAALAAAIAERIEVFAPAELALEEAFHGKSAQAALRIGEARGVVLATAFARGLQIHQFPPATIKRTVAGNGRAEKEAVARMALSALGHPPLSGPADASDAVAVALCRALVRSSPFTALSAGSL